MNEFRNKLSLAKEVIISLGYDKQALAEFNDVLEDYDIPRINNLNLYSVENTMLGNDFFGVFTSLEKIETAIRLYFNILRDTNEVKIETELISNIKSRMIVSYIDIDENGEPINNSFLNNKFYFNIMKLDLDQCYSV